MAEEQELEQHANLSLKVRSSILEAIARNLEKEKLADLNQISQISGAVAAAANTDLYTKGPPTDNYSKNTKREMLGRDVIRNLDDIRTALGGLE